jgi:hypothetical protein
MLETDTARVWASVNAMLAQRLALWFAQASHCALAEPGQIRAAADPQRVLVKFIETGECLRDCTADQRTALCVETLHPTLPVVAPRMSRPGPGRKMQLRKRGAWSKCSLLTRQLGRQVSEDEYLDLVHAAYECVAATMRRTGRLEVTRYLAGAVG